MWNAFAELNNARPQGFSGPCGIPSTEIKAWLDLNNLTDYAYWVPLLRAMDAAYLTKNEQEPNPDD